MLTPTATSMLRSGVARTSGLQPILFRAATCPYSTAALVSPFSPFSQTSLARPAPPSKSLHASVPRAKKSGPSALLIRSATTPVIIRTNSTKASPSLPSSRQSDAELDARAAAAAATASAQTAAQPPDQPPLDWNTFFALRRTRRRWQLGFSVATAVGAVGVEGGMLGTGAGSVLSDWLTSALPLDPMITMGLATIVCFGLGWLVGPSIGSFCFNLSNGRYKKQMAAKESQFFARIKKNRVDPTSSSANNPVPDYYGEKISSVAGYRQWLKDQRAYNKKRTTFL